MLKGEFTSEGIRLMILIEMGFIPWIFDRRYTRFVSDTPSDNKEDKPTTVAVQRLAALCISKYKKWDASISNWQLSVLKDS
jgi:hypothetical protein